jgi:alanyl-tRNA synthetase
MKTNLSSSEIREIFLRFFEARDHLRIPAASLVPKDDPTLLFINAGMAPMKKYFVGADKPPRPDLCNVQPCIRTIDIEEVGDRHHLTLFEMLGSWSIGNYFKDRAVELAFELLVEHFGFPAEKLYVSVYEGNPDIGLPPDDVTARAWERVGIARDHIVYLGEDNFWGPAGDHGPCGPCTEVYFDTGPEYGEAYQPGGEFGESSRYIEIWNAGVFMELDKKPDGRFERLPFTSVDTGSGLERMAMVLGGHPTAYETDLLRPLFDGVTAEVGERAPVAERRVITDHLRASAFILAEGVRPGNEGRAYIPRRLIRKVVALSVRNDATQVNFDRLLGELVEQFGGAYPRLAARRDDILGAFAREVCEFEKVIGRGFERLDSLCGKPGFEISGADAFELFATYGVPIDLVRDFVRERGGRVDEGGFEREFRRHQEVSRATKAAEEGPWSPEASFHGVGDETVFTGYTEMESKGQIVGLLRGGARVERASAGEKVEVVADRSPFYSEGGGQVGDKGVIVTDDGEVAVEDTQELGGRYVHRGEVARGEISVGSVATLRVDESRRRLVMANHSATHLLHSALRRVLGEHATQAGSLVEADRLRLDLEHPKKLSLEELHELERLVNRDIQHNYTRDTRVTSYDDAIARGALAFFGEAYGDTVRMVQFGPVSTELCGGTHVHATGDIGMFRITQESSVASGVRRIVAVTGPAAVDYTLDEDRILKQVAAELKTSVSELPQRVAALKQRPKDEQKAKAESPAIDAKAATQQVGDLALVAARLDDASADAIREEALRVADVIDGVAVLAGAAEGKVRLVVAVAKARTGAVKAPAVLKQLAPIVGGRGGGQPHLAQGGGTDTAAIAKLLEQAASALASARG